MVSSHAEAKLLNLTPTHEFSPASFGVTTPKGSFYELIKLSASLPTERSDTLWAAFDFLSHGIIEICCRPSGMHAAVVIKKLELPNMRKDRKEKTKVAITIAISNDLRGKFTACYTLDDASTEGRESLFFDGTEARTEGNDSVIIANQLHYGLLSS